MLDNLKLGGTSSITLTPSDSNVASNFTLPALTTGGSPEYDNPRVYGPVPGDSGSGATNYGYLYNFAAATAGATRTSLPAGNGNAPSSICPAGWRLPRSGFTDMSDWPYQPSATNDFANLDIAFGGTGTEAYSGEPNISQWQPDGAFQGAFSGYWSGGFYSQGGWGNLWSASADPDWTGDAFGASFDPAYVYPGDRDYYRYDGFGVRCLLN